MDLRQISYFVALYEEGSVTRAAERVHVVQPALSMQIAKLERELGQLLFDRQPRAVVPTVAGRALHRLVRPILDDVAAAHAAMARLSAAVTGRVTAGILSSLTMNVVPGALLRFAEAHPDVELSLADGTTSSFIAGVGDGSLDLAVINRPERPLGLVVTPLLGEEMVLVGGRDTVLPVPLPLRPHDLARFDLLLPSTRNGLRSALDLRLRAEGVALSPKLELDLVPAIAEVVGRSALFTILPAIAVSRQLADGSLKAYRIGEPRLLRQLAVVHRRDTPLSAAAAAFVAVLAEELAAATLGLDDRILSGPEGTTRDAALMRAIILRYSTRSRALRNAVCGHAMAWPTPARRGQAQEAGRGMETRHAAGANLPLVVGISGASGVIYGVRLLEILRDLDIPSHLVLSRSAEVTLAHETDLKVAAVRALATRCYAQADIGAAISSGSFRTRGMVVAPCSIRSMAEIASGVTSGLLTRAADVVLKDRRRLVLMVRETPLHAGHLRSMAALSDLGAVIAPPVPAFYARPNSIAEMVDHTVGRVLDLFDIDSGGVRRWKVEERPSP